jgi:hypothetical protein
MGIDHSESGKTAPEGDRCAPFLSIQEVSTEGVSRKTIASPHEKNRLCGSHDALKLPVHGLASRFFSAQRREQETNHVAVN